ncbi:hypothetical protein Micbo1qcDRAFT_209783 [Microdochium bolleyi]|uniref:Transcription factor domain-containing protein n=1 Tax=Microdochium bolleyi TaxID=196109 RepID=A0A136IL83_9PEZI|nr:hypothetical protein Micbo1qcDRAFT_209783 [Microdochium bolleyi]
MATKDSTSQCPICHKAYGVETTSRAKTKHQSYCRKKHEPGIPGFQASAQSPAGGANLKTASSIDGSPDGGPGVAVGDAFPQELVVHSESLTGTGEDAQHHIWELADDIDEGLFTTAFVNEDGLGDAALDAANNYNNNSVARYSSAAADPVLKSQFALPISLDFEKAASASSYCSLFERRTFRHPVVGASSDIALHILRSYPHMLASADGDGDGGKTTPPFIHPRYRDLADHDATRSSPLSVALGFSKMALHHGSGQGQDGVNRSLIWRLIRMEQDRLLTEHRKFNKWELLEATQSLVIYMLLRIIDGRRQEYTSHDFMLVASASAICGTMCARYGQFISPDEIMGQMVSWKDWAFYESRRRTATAVSIINAVLHAQIAPVSRNMPEYAVSPAPSPSKLWNADSEKAWESDYAEYLHGNALHGMLRNCDLVDLKKEADAYDDAEEEEEDEFGSGSGGGNGLGQDWEKISKRVWRDRRREKHDRWYAYADSFGLLVTLAADMIYIRLGRSRYDARSIRPNELRKIASWYQKLKDEL